MHEKHIHTRWTDFDALGHVTHVAYPVFLDEGRDAYLTETVGSFEEFPVVIAHLSLDHRGEIARPAAEVVVRTRVAEVGRSSITFEQEVLTGGELAATARAVVVAWDPDARSSRQLSEDERARLTRPL